VGQPPCASGYIKHQLVALEIKSGHGRSAPVPISGEAQNGVEKVV